MSSSDDRRDQPPGGMDIDIEVKCPSRVQEKFDRDIRIQRLKNFGKNSVKIIVIIVTAYYSKDKLWELVKGLWG